MSNNKYKHKKKVRDVDILVFGDEKAGKKSFVEWFVNQEILDRCHSKYSISQNYDYMEKKVNMPFESNTQANIRFWQ